MRWILAGLFLLISSSAIAQGALCGDREKILKDLESKYEEVVKHVAITARGAFVEWTVAPGGSWSMLVTSPNQITCMVASGEGWRNKTVVEGIRA